MMMKLSLLLVFALLALSSTSPLDTVNTEDRNVSSLNFDVGSSPEISPNRLITALPLLGVAKLRQKRKVQSSSFVSGDGSNLQWVTWNNSLPNYAVSIYNDYVKRTHYICKCRCEAGFYTPSEGSYCHYANKEKEYNCSPFEILVNKDNFEILEWKDDSYGSVPKDSVRTCPGMHMYIGKNKYGLGKVSTKDKVFYLPWEGSEYKYTSYQVLTTNENIISQKIYDVKYNTDESKIIQYPPEVIREKQPSATMKADQW
ncbi:natterin-3-like isoform X1 [Lates japonicus]|uniref:Natterin-3-like isoform X1 n=1 Tax=Lates japonicus TaxID=270547 RepID=A0AAD3RLV5_LATJO|nr:natterin-3-like isoform X1 [Lates japonicus]